MRTQAIKDLFTGREYPCQAAAPRDKKYWKLLNESHQELDEFKSKLSPEDAEVLDAIFAKRQDAMHFEITEAFTQGYALAAQLTSEAFIFNYSQSEEMED